MEKIFTAKEAAQQMYPIKENMPVFQKFGLNYIANHAFVSGADWLGNEIYLKIKELHDNENITGFTKRAYAQCLDIVESFKSSNP